MSSDLSRDADHQLGELLHFGGGRAALHEIGIFARIQLELEGAAAAPQVDVVLRLVAVAELIGRLARALGQCRLDLEPEQLRDLHLGERVIDAFVDVAEAVQRRGHGADATGLVEPVEVAVQVQVPRGNQPLELERPLPADPLADRILQSLPRVVGEHAPIVRAGDPLAGERADRRADAVSLDRLQLAAGELQDAHVAVDRAPGLGHADDPAKAVAAGHVAIGPVRPVLHQPFELLFERFVLRSWPGS